MKHVLAISALIFCLGIFLASFISVPFWLIYVLGVAFLLIAFSSIKNQAIFNTALFFLILILGAVYFANSLILPSCHISNIKCRTGAPCTIRGVIINQPQLATGKTAFILAAKQVQSNNLNRTCCGNILVSLKTRKNLRYGEELILEGSPDRNSSKGYSAYLSRQGIDLVLGVKNEAFIVRLDRNRGFLLKKSAFLLKQKIEKIFSQYLTPASAGILEAMVLGKKDNVPRLIYDSMVKTGTVHILVVSGFNTGLVSFIFLLFLKLLRLPRRARFVIVIPILLFYCLMTGASNPVMRATIMAMFFIAAHLIKREPDIYNSIALAALFILILNPRQLFDAGFQLSFASVLAIICLYPRLRRFCGAGKLQHSLLRYPVEACLVSFSAWIGTMGFIAFYFKTFSPITVIANIFVVPMATLITLCGFSLVLASLIFPPAVPFFANSIELAAAALIKCNTIMANLPYACFYL